MSRSEAKGKDLRINPFLTDQADELWRKIDQGGTPITKEELLERIRRNKRGRRK